MLVDFHKLLAVVEHSSDRVKIFLFLDEQVSKVISHIQQKESEVTWEQAIIEIFPFHWFVWQYKQNFAIRKKPISFDKRNHL